jgi:ribosomal protein S10
MTKKTTDSKKIRICIKAFDHKALDEAAKKIVSIAGDS